MTRAAIAARTRVVSFRLMGFDSRRAFKGMDMTVALIASLCGDAVAMELAASIEPEPLRGPFLGSLRDMTGPGSADRSRLADVAAARR